MSKDKHTFNTNTLKNNHNSQTNMFFSDAIEQWNKEQDMFLQQNTAELEAEPVSGKKFITSLGSTLSGIFHNKKPFPCIILVFYIALIFHILLHFSQALRHVLSLRDKPQAFLQGNRFGSWHQAPIQAVLYANHAQNT